MGYNNVNEKYKRCGVEVFRCLTDGKLLTEVLCQEGWCLGHRLGQPAFPSLSELMILRLGERVYNRVMSAWWRLLLWLSR